MDDLQDGMEREAASMAALAGAKEEETGEGGGAVAVGAMVGVGVVAVVREAVGPAVRPVTAAAATAHALRESRNRN